MSHARHTALNATATQPKTGTNSGSMRGDWLKATAMTMANEPSTTATNSGHVSGRPGAGRPGRGRTAAVVQKKRIMINPVRMKASQRWPCSSRYARCFHHPSGLMRLNASGQSGTARPTFSVVTAAPHQTRITAHATMNAAKHGMALRSHWSLVTCHLSLSLPLAIGHGERRRADSPSRLSAPHQFWISPEPATNPKLS